MEKTNIEQQIIEAAKQAFIENGYTQTSMSDIAQRVGINRPALHYYFRTKDRIFDAVFADIISPFIPIIQDLFTEDIPFEDRIVKLVDTYFEVLLAEPLLPVFMVKEIQRNADLIKHTITKFEKNQYIDKVKNMLLSEMEKGVIKTVPIEYVFYTIYGLIIIPFISKPLVDIIFERDRENDRFTESMHQWKEHVIHQIKFLLLK